MSKSVMNRRTMIKAMLGGGILTLGCKRHQDVRRLSLTEKMDLISSMKIVETGMFFGYKQVGMSGELGPLQLKRIYVDDCNRIIGETKFSYTMRERMPTCRSMILIYWDHYATPERLGHEPTLEDLARIHNGGPNGWKKESTKKYWKKVEKELKGIE